MSPFTFVVPPSPPHTENTQFSSPSVTDVYSSVSVSPSFRMARYLSSKCAVKFSMVENRKKHRQNSHPIIHCPTSEGVSEVSGASERANGRASGPVLQSVFLAVIDHSARFFWLLGCLCYPSISRYSLLNVVIIVTQKLVVIVPLKSVPGVLFRVPPTAPTLLPTAHYGRKQPRIQTEVLGHSLVRSLFRSHRSLIRLLRTARCAHLLARSTLDPELMGKRFLSMT